MISFYLGGCVTPQTYFSQQQKTKKKTLIPKRGGVRARKRGEERPRTEDKLGESLVEQDGAIPSNREGFTEQVTSFLPRAIVEGVFALGNQGGEGEGVGRRRRRRGRGGVSDFGREEEGGGLTDDQKDKKTVGGWFVSSQTLIVVGWMNRV